MHAEEMATAHFGGATLAEIGAQYGVTRERIRQILKEEYGITGKDGGAHKKAADLVILRANRRDEIYLQKYGVSHSEYVEINKFLNKDGRRPSRCFQEQIKNAHKRGIDWQLTFAEWWGIWSDSGMWKNRGRGHGYVMARHGDSGPYMVGNVKIITGAENQSEYIRQYWSDVKEGKREAPSHHSKYKTHCKHGHIYDEENTYYLKKSGTRTCRACSRESSRKYLLKKKTQRES